MPEKKNTIGRFEITEKIGEGPIGAVYKALDPVIRRTVAIKVIKLYALEETTTFAEVFEKIYRVVRTSTSLNHPNICIIYDLSEEKKIPYITMEYVEGHDLDSLLQKRHQFKRPELLNILQQVCDALDFAHKKGVIHQDLKSTNILITPDLNVKITDFGIAGLDEIAAAQTKKLLSIPHYISPEQALGERVSPSSDLFSLGVIVYQLLCGQLPFPGTTAANAIMMIARDNPSAPPNLAKSGISDDDWDSFFGIALAKSPNHRFHSAHEMFEALLAILPSSDQSYYPYTIERFSGESTGKIEEKTFIGEASPTVLIDPSKILEESLPQEAAVEIPEAHTVAPEIYEKTDPNLILPFAEETQPPLSEKTEMISQEALMAHAPVTVAPAPSAQDKVTLRPQAPATEMFRIREEEFPEEIVPPTPPAIEKSTKLISIPEAAAGTAPSPGDEQGASQTTAPTQMVEWATPPSAPQPAPAAPAAAARPAAAAQAQKVAAPKAAVAPNLRRYFVGAVVLAILIAVAGALFFLGTKPSQDISDADTTPAPQPSQNAVTTGQNAKSPLQASAGKISITSDPAGATVLLSDQEKGVTPLEIADLQLGKYNLKIQLKGYKDLEQQVELTQQSPVATIPLTLEKAPAVVGTLVVESEPSDAFIVIGNRVIGVTPKTLSNTKAGRYRIILKKDGYQDYEGSVRVSENKTATLRAQLVGIPEPTPPPAQAAAKEPEVRPGQLVTPGPDVMPAKAIKKTYARYPQAAREKKIGGTVSLNVLVSETGNVLDVKITKAAHPLLDEAAMRAVKDWVFEPATKNGVPVKIWTPVTMTFQMR